MNAALAEDRLFKALADPTRRRVVERLSKGPASVSVLAEPFKMALPSFVQHLRVLEQSGVVGSTKRGRVRTYRLEPRGIRRAEAWLSKQRAMWEQRLDQLDAFLLGEARDERDEDTMNKERS
jgi:DNA-binding transcriptional ArsR family regulator